MIARGNGGREYMRQVFPFVLAMLALVAVPNVAFAAETVLKPNSPWSVDLNDKTCTLRRVFGTTEDPFILRFERFAPGNAFQTVIASKQFRQVDQRSFATITYGGGAPIYLTGRFMPGTSNNSLPTLFLPSDSLLPNDKKTKDIDESEAVTTDVEVAVTSVSMRFSDRRIRLETGSLGKALAALRQCTDDLVRHWGLDPTEQATLQRRATPLSNPANWAKPGDYPSKALNIGQQAIVSFRLVIDKQGMPTACEIQRAYADAAFQKLTCELLMSRARFEPAINAAGQPTASYFATTARWIMSY
jgi:hypothetical protein